MDRKEFIFNVLKESQRDLIALGVSSIGIFGSVVRGESHSGSDYDILVEFRPGEKSFRNFNRLCDFLEEKLDGDFDLVTKEGLSPHIGPRILREVEYVSLAS